MKLRKQSLLALAGVLAIGGALTVKARFVASANLDAASVNALGMSVGTPDLKAAGALAFGPENVLFIGDSQGAAVFAVEVKDDAKATGDEPVNIDKLDQKLAARLGTTTDAVVINDMAVHPVSQNVYLSVSRGRGNDAVPVLLRATKSGTLEEVALKEVAFSKVSLADVPGVDAKDRRGNSLRRLAITDLAFAEGEVLIAGLSNAEFASTLRRAAFPFKQEVAASKLEIYHTSHDRYETASPIETFLPFPINGKPSLLAGYGCAPIAAFTLADIKAKQQLRGTTLAELGGGNRPVDMIAFEKEGKRRVLIANSDRTLMSMSAEDIEKATPMTKPVAAAYVSGGVPYLSIAEVGVTQLDNLNAKHIVMVQRDIQSGALHLRSLQKGWL